MSSQIPKLYYFHLEARGEVTREMFKLASEQFEDIRYTFEEWRQIKATGNTDTPFGQLPVLKIADDVSICQSHAIEYYVAKKHGFLGTGLIEETKIIMISNCVEDSLTPIYKLYAASGEEKARIIKKYEDEQLEDYFTKLTILLKANSNSDYFVGNKVSLADLRLHTIFSFFKYFDIKFDEKKFPEIVKLRDHVTKML